jgi:hypothetical protein
MNINDMLGGDNQRQVEALARQFGLDEAQTRAALEQLAPVVAAGMRQQAQSAEGLGQLIQALARGTMGGMSAANPDEMRAHGNDILSQIFGDKDVSRGVAQQISGQTGIGASVLKQLLPVIAMAVASSFLKTLFTGGASPAPQRQTPRQADAGGGMGGGLGDILNDMLGGGQGRGQPQRQAPQGGGGGLGDILNDMLGGGQGRGQPQRQAPQGGGGGLGDILNDMLGGGQGRGQPQRQAPQGGSDIDRLRDVLSDLITGGQQGGRQTGGTSYEADPRQSPRRAPAPESAPQQMPRGDGGIGDILRDILGGAPPPREPSQPGAQTGSPQAPQRSPLDDLFGTPGAPSRSAADDLLDAVQRRLGRR